MRPPRPKSRAKPKHTEAQEQRKFVKQWRLDPRTRDLPACAIPNGVRTSMLQAVLAKAEGMSKGAPDWLCFEHERPKAHHQPMPLLGYALAVGLALEFKRPDKKGTLSVEQRGWHAELRRNHWHVAVVTSAAEAWNVVEEYFGWEWL